MAMFTGEGETVYQQQFYLMHPTVSGLKKDLAPIYAFTETHEMGSQFKIGLKRGISFEQLKNFFPEVTKSGLKAFFDFLEAHPQKAKLAIAELQGVTKVQAKRKPSIRRVS